ncbi:MAG: PDZ domain-containing protein, partial [Actinomycetota bacterium]|nr:PDZ domain-containing protein [Actinomycetota bacterium]
LEEEEGVLVAEVPEGGPADQAGIEPGDLVTALEGEEVRSVEDFLGFLRRSERGDVVEVELVRDGDEMTIDVTLAGRPSS